MENDNHQQPEELHKREGEERGEGRGREGGGKGGGGREGGREGEGGIRVFA